MDARSVDTATRRLHELRREERDQLGVAAFALGVAVAATQVVPQLAVPIFLGGLFVGALGVRALWRRWDLVDRLAAERDAYVIAEVRDYAAREATLDRRQSLAASIRIRLREPVDPRICLAVGDLEALASELDDEGLTLDPVCAVACARLLSDTAGSALLNPALPPEQLRSSVRQIRAGFAVAAAREVTTPVEFPRVMSGT